MIYHILSPIIGLFFRSLLCADRSNNVERVKMRCHLVCRAALVEWKMHEARSEGPKGFEVENFMFKIILTSQSTPAECLLD